MKTTKNPPIIAELVGVAGSGKTTISQALSRSSTLIQQSLHPNPRDFYDLQFFLRNGLKVLMHLPGGRTGSRRFSRRELAWMAILQGWPEYLRKKNSKIQALVLDQGPIFLIAALHHFDPQKIATLLDNRWWREILRSWSNTLDIIVWLDASDETLRERLRRREKWHIVKNETDSEVQAFLTRHRTVYQQTIPYIVGENHHPKILSIDTGKSSMEETMNLITVEMGL